MFPRRFAAEAGSATRALRRPMPRSVANARVRTQNARFQSTSANSSSSNASSSGSPALVGALTGSLTTFTLGYLWYRQSGARDLLAATKTTKDYVNTASQKLKEATPEPNEALQWLRQTATSYAMFIPGARAYVDAAFNDIDAIRAKHGDEVDKIVSDAYSELRNIAQKGDLSLLTAQKAWNVIIKHLGRIGDLTGDAAQQIMDNHPQLKEKVGGNLDTLKQLGDKYGPEAKKEVDRTWQQIGDIVKTGVSAQNIEKIQKVVQEKVDKIKQLGDEAWKKGMEKAKPYLDKNPTAKKLIEENEDALKSGNVQELYEKVKQAVEKGDTGDLEGYIKKFTDKAKDSGLGDVEQYLKKIPGGDQILPKLSQLQEVAEKHGDEAQRILKEAVNEISEVLKKKGDEATNLAKKAKDDSKK
ncbi:hypothetical protein BU24DRAFT_422562 [Aaosphaeria arxii CBS 175.79]|uniref:Apolipoprotein/apolipophorin n=1 Tax=Aaosphaeria arxii CBS 175.79 TaxID=1450172 RepID=A0A6A5XTE3_9PLEO|nr:uncharacterized protein BU24DRAFT_422562 [Aaosphaeria arxii CBS 175.79]KAF2016213.1 hypothetical protein BU24DRAFT_422562 [Aaosphaeria arxii CBS 175.79]